MLLALGGNARCVLYHTHTRYECEVKCPAMWHLRAFTAVHTRVLLRALYQTALGIS